jgi:integrase
VSSSFSASRQPMTRWPSTRRAGWSERLPVVQSSLRTAGLKARNGVNAAGDRPQRPCPAGVATAQRVLAIPAKRTRRTIVTYLTADEADAVLAACDQGTWTGRRDHAMLALTLRAGLRISELASLARQDIVLTA